MIHGIIGPSAATVDTHFHAYQDVPAVADLFARFNFRGLNITLIADRDPFRIP